MAGDHLSFADAHVPLPPDVSCELVECRDAGLRSPGPNRHHRDGQACQGQVQADPGGADGPTSGRPVARQAREGATSEHERPGVDQSPGVRGHDLCDEGSQTPRRPGECLHLQHSIQVRRAVSVVTSGLQLDEELDSVPEAAGGAQHGFSVVRRSGSRPHPWPSSGKLAIRWTGHMLQRGPVHESPSESGARRSLPLRRNGRAWGSTSGSTGPWASIAGPDPRSSSPRTDRGSPAM